VVGDDAEMLPGEDSRVGPAKIRMFRILETIAEEDKTPTPSRVSIPQTIIEHGPRQGVCPARGGE
jgi:hypothetical protein